MKTVLSAKGLRRAVCLLLLVALQVMLPAGAAQAARRYVVAQDGSGNFTTVQAAINAVKRNRTSRTEILIKPGVYKEKLIVPADRDGITLLGENRDLTIITGDDYITFADDGSVIGGPSQTVYVAGSDFAARNITFANTAGDVGPAIAVYLQGDRARFHHCAFLGYQDTLCTLCNNAYFAQCLIEGACDFIFGNATAVFEHCSIHCIGEGYVTAADTRQVKQYGYVFDHCNIYGDVPDGQMYLGRAWGDYAKVTYLNCTMDAEIAPVAWDDWSEPSRQETTFYAEYHSTGAGAATAERADWSHQLSNKGLKRYTLDKIFPRTTNSPELPVDVVTTPWYQDF